MALKVLLLQVISQPVFLLIQTRQQKLVALKLQLIIRMICNAICVTEHTCPRKQEIDISLHFIELEELAKQHLFLQVQV